MKNIMTYISPNREFNPEHKALARIQIDNSLDLGWKPENIILVTNFPYEYNGVRSIQVKDDAFCAIHWPATKIWVLVRLFDKGLIGKGLYWYHDFDCFQFVKFSGKDADLSGADFGVTNYGRMPRLCSASMLFTQKAEDIFCKIKDEVERTQRGEESRITIIAPTLGNRFKHLNITWAFHRFNLRSCWRIVDKPIKAAHFHLTPDKYAFYVLGENKLGIRIVPDRLVNIFHDHGWTRDRIW